MVELLFLKIKLEGGMPVLTKPNAHYSTNYSRRSSLVSEYQANMLTYLTKIYPDKDVNDLSNKIHSIINKSYKPTNVQYLSMSSPGNIDVKSDLLLDHTNHITDGIVTPYGSTYVPIRERVSMFTNYIGDNQAERKRVKREELIAEAQGDKATKQFKFLRQLNIKININVLSGVMLSSVAFKSSINYNSITATARFGIMTSYAISELMLEGNYYFENEDRAINWIVNLLRIYPGDGRITQCIEQYDLAIPSVETTYIEYVKQLRQYCQEAEYPYLKQLINNLTSNELVFVYYAMNLARLFRENSSFHTFFKQLIDMENVKNLEGEVPLITTLEDDAVRTMSVVAISDEIPDKCTIDEIAKTYPDLNRRVYSVYRHIEDSLERLSYLFDTFIFLPILPAEIRNHRNMIRRTILLSDTDSIMFTATHWIKWFTGDIRVSRDSIRVNSAMCTIMTKILENSLAYMSASMGIDEPNIKLIALKNEFMYDVFMRTPISKHYAGYIRYREGMRMTPCKLDLKGKNFKGSDLPSITTKFVKKFIKDTFDDFLVTYELRPDVLITKVIRFEQMIKKSVLAGEVIFLGQKPINLKASYKIPDISAYIYYELWEHVFAKKYGDLHLPQKCKEVFIHKVDIKNTRPLDHMRDVDPEIHKRFIEFLKKWPKKSFARVMIPMDMTIPEELISITDYKKVIKTNCYSLELVLKSFNVVNFPTKHGINLFSDTYTEILAEVLNSGEFGSVTEVDAFDDEEELEDDPWEFDDDYSDDESDDSDNIFNKTD